MKITPADLRRRRACDEQVAIFAAEWPEGCEVTEATCLRAVELELDVHWAARRLLPEPLLDEYLRQEKPLRDEFERQRALLFARFVQEAGL